MLLQCRMNPHRAVFTSYTRSPQADLKQAVVLEAPQLTTKQNSISCHRYVFINKTGLNTLNVSKSARKEGGGWAHLYVWNNSGEEISLVTKLM